MRRTVEKYEILEEIGHGGMATVYRARDTRLDRLVALKILHPHLRGSREAQARFRREAQGVARLKHPRVLEIYDYSGEGSEESWIATELLTGPTLRKLADDAPPMLAEIAACFGIEVCRALTHAHAAGIIHRDVKPENILVHEARELKLTDFGIADMVDQHTMTATGQILGSPGHMSPEQIEGKDIDARTDVFALGTVLYFLACGRLPFVGKNPAQVLRRIGEGEYPDPLRVRPQIGGKMRAIVQKALAHDAEKRQRSAAELEAELRAFASECGIDDPEAQLEAYLQDPTGATAMLEKRVVATCITRGKVARDQGQIPEALDYFARALALDEGNEEVLALVESVGRGQRQRTAAYAVAGLAAAALVAAGAWGAGAFGAADPVALAPDAGFLAAAGPPDASTFAASADAVPELAALEPDAAGSPPDAGAALAEVRIPRPETPPIRARPEGPPRPVRFFIDLPNFQASIDDGPARTPLQLRALELSLGSHTIGIDSPTDCCIPLRRTLDVGPGEGPFEIRETLRSRDATLLVSSAVPASLVIDGVLSARTNETVSVPIPESRRRTVSISVTAPGFREYTQTGVLLEAGQERTLRVTLQALGTDEAPGSE